MKLALVTDLHANREAVAAIRAHAQQQKVDRYVFLGDLVGYGADPGWVVDWVREEMARGALAVRGNHDHAVATSASATMRDEVQQAIVWTQRQLTADQLAFLAHMPLECKESDLHFVHANAHAPAQWGYIESRTDAGRSLQATSQRVVFCGHTHSPMLYHLSRLGKLGEFIPSPSTPVPLMPQRQWLVIPGAAGQPRDGNPAACYATYDTQDFALTFWRVPYDHDAAATKILNAGLPPAFAHRLRHGR